MKTKSFLVLAALAAGLRWSARADEISLQSAPPVVVKTVPVAGATDVDPGLTEIKVTYSKAMQDGSWSWSTWGEENFPETTGKSRYLKDGRTCVLPVRLQPQKFYAIWLNSEKFKNFKDASGQPAVPYLLTFYTGDSTERTSRQISEVSKPARKFVRLVAGKGQMTFEGKPTTRQQLEDRLAEVPDRSHTVLELAVTADGPPATEFLEIQDRAMRLVKQLGFEYLSLVGVHPLGSKAGESAHAATDSTSGVEVAVESAVTTISGCAEGDPRVTKALESLQPLDQSQAVRALVSYLDSSQPTIRRAAIYILWKGGFANVSPAAADLEKLLSHKEDLTRGMAALALGQNRVRESFDALAKMTREDQSGYARRCAAYALGLLGDARAKPVLEAALKDSEALVRNNAKAALDMIAKSSQTQAGGAGAPVFGPVVEAVLRAPDGRVAELLDLDTGARATNRDFGENDRETHAWIRENKLDVLGVVEKGNIAVLCMDMVVVPGPSNSFKTVTASEVRSNWNLAQGEPNKITGISPETEKTDTWFFRTRENGLGVIQILGQSEDLRGIKIRYKLVEKRVAGGGAGRNQRAEFIQLLNDDQRAVLEWTDRRFRSFFDERDFAGWSEKERSDLELRSIDALKGPRTREYYQAINTLAALHFTNGLPALRGIAYDRAEKDNRDRWMAIRAIGMLGDKSDVPELIPLVYHGNLNTRWWAQISLVRLTGQNFGKDWNAWGKWWNDQNGQPPYKPEIIRWWSGQAEPGKLAESLDESDVKFLNSIKPQASASKEVQERDEARGGEQYLQQQLKLAEAGNYWAKFHLWEAYSKGEHDVNKNPVEADKWLSELAEGAYLAKFEPVNGFSPKTPGEMLDNFSEYCRLFSGRDSLGGASFFRTTKQDDKLIGSFLTATPDKFKAAIEQNPKLKLISIEKLTPEMFLQHEAAKQESL